MELRLLRQNEDKNDKIFTSEECQQLLAVYEDYYPKIGFVIPWVAYIIIKDDSAVGTCSFTGKPKNGAVEIAYWTFKGFEGQGVASFACSELIKIARKENPEIIITAKTSPEHNSSTRVLEKNGFNYVKVVQDEDIGDAWFWVLDGKAISSKEK